MDIDLQQFDPPADVVTKDHFSVIFQGPLEHEMFHHGVVIIVAAINLAWAYFTFGFRLLTHTLQHVVNSVNLAIDGDLMGATVGGLLDYSHHCVHAATALWKQTLDLGHVALFGHGYEDHTH